MNKEKEFLLWFEQMERGDVAIVGGKSSSLGEMTSKTDVPVPYGFATTAYAYRYFIEKSGLKEKCRLSWLNLPTLKTAPCCAM